MKEQLNTRIDKLVKKASLKTAKVEVRSSGHSSLHQIIKTKQQADLFMKLLKEA